MPTDETFDAVSASYTLRSIDPVSGVATHPDDNEPMVSWGTDAIGHHGYFSFGTPSTIVNAGGVMGSDVAFTTTTRAVTFSEGSVAATNIVRFGFSQSGASEDFSIENLSIIIRVVT